MRSIAGKHGLMAKLPAPHTCTAQTRSAGLGLARIRLRVKEVYLGQHPIFVREGKELKDHPAFLPEAADHCLRPRAPPRGVAARAPLDQSLEPLGWEDETEAVLECQKSSRSAALPPGFDEVLRLDAQRVGHPGDVVEVGDHLDGVVDGPVVETMGAQGF